MIRVKLTQAVGRWSVVSKGHADEHVCLAASTLFNAITAGLETLTKVYPKQIRVTFTDETPDSSVAPATQEGQ